MSAQLRYFEHASLSYSQLLKSQLSCSQQLHPEMHILSITSITRFASNIHHLKARDKRSRRCAEKGAVPTCTHVVKALVGCHYLRHCWSLFPYLYLHDVLSLDLWVVFFGGCPSSGTLSWAWAALALRSCTLRPARALHTFVSGGPSGKVSVVCLPGGAGNCRTLGGAGVTGSSTLWAEKLIVHLLSLAECRSSTDGREVHARPG